MQNILVKSEMNILYTFWSMDLSKKEKKKKLSGAKMVVVVVFFIL